MIDAQRNEPAAQAWLNAQAPGELAISQMTQLEVLVGCTNNLTFQRDSRALRAFRMLPLSAEIGHTAEQLVRMYGLSHRLLVVDSIIAATALVEDLPLATKNRKDFRFIAGLQLVSYP